jgi:hypothetical protein
LGLDWRRLRFGLHAALPFAAALGDPLRLELPACVAVTASRTKEPCTLGTSCGCGTKGTGTPGKIRAAIQNDNVPWISWIVHPVSADATIIQNAGFCVPRPGTIFQTTALVHQIQPTLTNPHGRCWRRKVVGSLRGQRSSQKLPSKICPKQITANPPKNEALYAIRKNHQKIRLCKPQTTKKQWLCIANSLKYEIALRKNHQKTRLCKPQTTPKNDSASQTAWNIRLQSAKTTKNKTLQTANNQKEWLCISLKYQIAIRKNHQKTRLCKPQTA